MRPTDPVHRAGIHIRQKLCDGCVQGLNREELLHIPPPGIVPKARLRHDDPALDDQHRALDFPFVAGLAWAGGQRGRVVMRRHVGESPEVSAGTRL